MFSRRERDFLAAVIRYEEVGGVGQRELLESFPNPTYRRKLLWGIRRKAATAAADWELYVRAARVESKVLPELAPSELPPLAADPLVTITRSVRDYLKLARRSSPPRPPRPSGARQGEDRR